MEQLGKLELKDIVRKSSTPISVPIEMLRFAFGYERISGEAFLLRKLINPNITEEQAHFLRPDETHRNIQNWCLEQNIAATYDHAGHRYIFEKIIIRNNSDRTLEDLKGFLDRCIDQLDKRLLQYRRKGVVFLSLPDFIIRILMTERLYKVTIDSGTIPNYKGFILTPGYEKKAVFFHNDHTVISNELLAKKFEIKTTHSNGVTSWHFNAS